MKAKKSLGQNFLRNKDIIMEIIHAGDVHTGDIVLEVGPGHGDLTEQLLAYSSKLIAVEKDDDLYESLKEKFSREILERKLTLVHGDILEFDPASYKLEALSYKLVANIPYNITGAILRKFLSAQHQPEHIVVLVQKEVAERIARSEKESILSISVKVYGKPEMGRVVKAGSFVPAPQVDSAILSIKAINKNFFNKFSEEAFFELLHAGFSSKRKKLSSNLSSVSSKESTTKAFDDLRLDLNARAEELSVTDWQNLAEKLLPHGQNL